MEPHLNRIGRRTIMCMMLIAGGLHPASASQVLHELPLIVAWSPHFFALLWRGAHHRAT